MTSDTRLFAQSLHDAGRLLRIHAAIDQPGLDQVAEACGNHTSGAVSGVAAVYARHGYAKEKRQALLAWGRHVLALAPSGADAKVMPLQPRAVTG